MKYLRVVKISERWGISGRTVRMYCAEGKIAGAVKVGKTWYIPEDANMPIKWKREFNSKNKLLNKLREEKKSNIQDGIYNKTQIEYTYQSNCLDDIELSKQQIKNMFENSNISSDNENLNIENLIETSNHFKCMDYIIDNAQRELSRMMIKELYFILKVGTKDFHNKWVMNNKTKTRNCDVEELGFFENKQVNDELKRIINKFNFTKNKTLKDIMEFHQNFMEIHPFFNGNGRIGRLLILKECLKNNIVPFIIDKKLKSYYLNGLENWEISKSVLIAVAISTQDQYKKYLDELKIENI